MIIGFDLDGVIAQPLFDGILVKARIIKEHLLKSFGRQTDYFYPKSRIEQLAWTYLNQLRKPSCDANHLESLRKSGNFSFVLITSRLRFLERDTREWLERYHLDSVFDKIEINTSDLNPVDFKTETINRDSIGYYLDDDLEILEALRGHVSTQLYWLSPKAFVGSGVKNSRSVEEFLKQLTNSTRN